MSRLCYCLFLVLLAGCQKNELNFSLTPITQTGANTFSCLVDGRVFTPYGKRCVGYGGGCMEGIEAYYNGKRGQLIITAVLFANGRDELVSLGGDSIFSIGELKVLRPTNYHHSGVGYTEQDKSLSWATQTDMSIVLTRLDTVAHIMSGTFQGNLKLTLVNPTTQKPAVAITNGRFDVTYPK